MLHISALPIISYSALEVNRRSIFAYNSKPVSVNVQIAANGRFVVSKCKVLEGSQGEGMSKPSPKEGLVHIAHRETSLQTYQRSI
jgi:hypothetical protein